MIHPTRVDLFHPPPGHPLAAYVLTIFRVRCARASRGETILPKGNVDLLFNLGAPLFGRGLVPDGYRVDADAAWVGGLKTRPYVVQPQGEVDVLGVSLRADSCAALLPLAPGEITNLELHGGCVPAEIRDLAGRLREAADFAPQCSLLLRWLGRRVHPPRGAGIVRHACALLRRSRQVDPVRATAKELAVSPRHLRRLVTEHVGVGPAEYVRLTRFVDALHGMAAPRRTLTEVAYAAGYYDQAHLCREFRAFAGMTPQEYRGAAPGPTVGHLYLE